MDGDYAPKVVDLSGYGNHLTGLAPPKVRVLNVTGSMPASQKANQAEFFGRRDMVLEFDGQDDLLETMGGKNNARSPLRTEVYGYEEETSSSKSRDFIYLQRWKID